MADPDRRVVTKDLLPELAKQPFRWCNSCNIAEAAYIFPQDNLLALDVIPNAIGAGAGYYPPPRFFDATTLTELANPASQPVMQDSCSSDRALLPPIQGRIYRQVYYARYVLFRNLNVYDLQGHLITWRDGLYASFIDPNTGQAITSNGYVLDLSTLLPVGSAPTFCLLAAYGGRIYGADGSDLVVLEDKGGQPIASLPAQPESLPARPLSKILVSPNYAVDKTLFVLFEDNILYRSRDGGLSWSHVRGGLPADHALTLALVMSPDYANDQTLFAGGFVREYQGEGVWRSTDGGDTWQALWNGLPFLRVYQIAVSPKFAADKTLLAYSRFTRIKPWSSGVAMFRSTDRGLSWSQVVTATDASNLPAPTAMFPSLAISLPVRIGDYGRVLEHTVDGGKTGPRSR